jgi:hypothetical protein
MNAMIRVFANSQTPRLTFFQLKEIDGSTIALS